MGWHYNFIAAHYFPPVVGRTDPNAGITALTASPPVPGFEEFMRRYEHTPSPNIALRL